MSFPRYFVINLTILFLIDPWQSGYTIRDWPSISIDAYFRLSAEKQSEKQDKLSICPPEELSSSTILWGYSLGKRWWFSSPFLLCANMCRAFCHFLIKCFHLQSTDLRHLPMRMTYSAGRQCESLWHCMCTYFHNCFLLTLANALQCDDGRLLDHLTSMLASNP